MSPWYGADPVWRVAVEAAARRRFGTDLRIEHELDLARIPGPPDRRPFDLVRLTYTVIDLEVDGHPGMVDLTITFWSEPGYDTYGQRPQDAPKVYAEPGLDSLHRYGDDSLCLWTPFNPLSFRWTSDRGLLDLIEIARRHLLLERFWRLTGGHNGGVWLLPDTPHGLPRTA